MTKLPIRLVSFDAFETIISPRFPPSVVYSRAARSLRIDVNPEQLQPLYQESYLYYRKKYPNFGAYDDITACDWWGKVIRRALLSFLAPNQEIPSSFCSSLFDQYNSGRMWRLEPGALECLKAIRQLHPQLHISVLSNFDERLPRILTELEIIDFFEDVLFSTMFPFHKPDPRFFRILLDRHPPLTSAQCLHVGNSLETDYYAALEVGMQARLYNVKGDKVDPSVQTISSLRELVSLLQDNEDHSLLK